MKIDIGGALVLVACLAACAPALAAMVKGSAADLVLEGGVIVTLDDSRPRATALAVKDGRFVAVGTNEEVRRHIGPDTRVILMSDHGFHPDHLRPRSIPRIPAGPAIEHRDFGILAMAGPGIKQDELLHGAGILDITPTLLAMFGLPVGDDMDGKVLAGAFEEPPPVQSIPSWEA